jgi:hypothetical protein
MSGTQEKTAPGQSDSTSDLEKASLETVYATLGTSPEGLVSSEARQRLEK